MCRGPGTESGSQGTGRSPVGSSTRHKRHKHQPWPLQWSCRGLRVGLGLARGAGLQGAPGPGLLLLRAWRTPGQVAVGGPVRAPGWPSPHTHGRLASTRAGAQGGPGDGIGDLMMCPKPSLPSQKRPAVQNPEAGGVPPPDPGPSPGLGPSLIRGLGRVTEVNCAWSRPGDHSCSPQRGRAMPGCTQGELPCPHLAAEAPAAGHPGQGLLGRGHQTGRELATLTLTVLCL